MIFSPIQTVLSEDVVQHSVPVPHRIRSNSVHFCFIFGESLSSTGLHHREFPLGVEGRADLYNAEDNVECNDPGEPMSGFCYCSALPVLGVLKGWGVLSAHAHATVHTALVRTHC